MAFLKGSAAAVKLGSTTVVGMGNWELPGVSVDLLDSTSFGDVAKQSMTGMLDYGNVNFGGLYDAANTAGQTLLVSANVNNSKIGNIRLYVDTVSYWTPDVTADADAGMLVQSVSIGMDKSGLGTIKFTGKCTGPWALV